jgi:hypothetical protein
MAIFATWQTTRTLRVWYDAGLRFSCTRCGDCCRRAPGEEKHVYLDAADLARLENALGLSRAELLHGHVDRLDEVTLVLKWSETQCSFLGPGGCTVYDARPAQCRTFPFWPENLASEDAWTREVLGKCPGSRDPEARLYSIGELRSLDATHPSKRS